MTFQLTLPEICTDPPHGCADAYDWDEAAGVWRLSDQARVELAAANADLEQREQEYVAKLAELQAQHDKLSKQLNDRIVSSGLRDAIQRCGVNSKIAAGAAAYFRAEFKLIAQEDGRVVVSQDGGEVDLFHAVETWLHSDVGSPFAKRTPVLAADKFTAALRRVTGE
jgi:hypothetical protein